LTDAGYNLSSDGTCGLSGISSISAADPDLGPLRYNGGPTPTQAPARNSRAVDAIPRKAVADVGGQGVPLCAGTTDQRGVHRPQAVRRDRCDIGAIELAVGPAIPRQLLSRGG
jgi:hypothetical protein